MFVELLSHTESPEKVIGTAARVCYAPGTVNDVWNTEFNYGDFIQKLRTMGHMSPFEHANFTWGIDGISRACSHQLVRHRVASFSQQSQRYVEYDMDNPDCFNLDDFYVVPELLVDSNSEASDVYLAALDSVSDVYAALVDSLKNEGFDARQAAENARYILPNAMKTNLVMTMNARELMHFFNVRCCRRAQLEIRELAWSMFDICTQRFPEIFENCGPNCLQRGCTEGRMSCGNTFADTEEGFEGYSIYGHGTKLP